MEYIRTQRPGPLARLETSYGHRPEMTFVVQGDKPSQCLAAARAEAARRFGHMYSILAANITDPQGRTVQVLVEARRVGAAPTTAEPPQ